MIANTSVLRRVSSERDEYANSTAAAGREAVDVVQLHRRPVLARQQQQAERRLAEDDRVARASTCSNARPAVSRPRQIRSPQMPAIRLIATTKPPRAWWTTRHGGSMRENPGHDCHRGTARSRLLARRRHGRDGAPRRPARHARRPVLLPQGRHARLHAPGLRAARRLGRSRGDRRAHLRRLARRRREPRRASTTKFDLPFPLLADTDRSVVEAYGFWGDASERARSGVVRSTVLIGADGTVEQRLEPGRPRRAPRHHPRGAGRLT